MLHVDDMFLTMALPLLYKCDSMLPSIVQCAMHFVALNDIASLCLRSSSCSLVVFFDILILQKSQQTTVVVRRNSSSDMVVMTNEQQQGVGGHAGINQTKNVILLS